MRLATFNIRHGTDGPGDAADDSALARAITALGADVLGVQEVDRGRRRSAKVDQVALMGAAAGGAAAFSRSVSFADGEYGNALVVRGRLHDVEVVPLPHLTPPWERRSENRSALLAGAEVDDWGLSVLVTHLSTHWYEAVGQLQTACEALAHRPPPRVLLGDLNLGRLLAFPLLRRLGLSPVTAGGPTYPRRRPRSRIDHIATSGLRVERVAVVDTGVSDHRALVVDVAAE